jgi:hypothetical protein
MSIEQALAENTAALKALAAVISGAKIVTDAPADGGKDFLDKKVEQARESAATAVATAPSGKANAASATVAKETAAAAENSSAPADDFDPFAEEGETPPDDEPFESNVKDTTDKMQELAKLKGGRDLVVALLAGSKTVGAFLTGKSPQEIGAVFKAVQAKIDAINKK